MHKVDEDNNIIQGFYTTEYKFTRYVDLKNASPLELFWENFTKKMQLSLIEKDSKFTTIKLKAYLQELCEYLKLCEEKEKIEVEVVKTNVWIEQIDDDDVEKISKGLMYISGFLLVFFTFASVYIGSFQLGVIAFVDLIIFLIAYINFNESKEKEKEQKYIGNGR